MFQKLGDNFEEEGNPGSRQLHDPRFKIDWLFSGSSGVLKSPGAGGTGAQVRGPIFNCWQFAGVSGVSLQQELQQPIQEDDCKRNFGWNHQ